MQPIKIRLALPQRVIQLGFDGNEVVEVVARAKGGSVTKENVLEKAAGICVDILIAKERPNMSELLRYLRVEGGHIVDPRILLVSMPDQETFVQELDSVLGIYHVRVHDGLAEAEAWPMSRVPDPVVIK